jgi:hypothetical protein
VPLKASKVAEATPSLTVPFGEDDIKLRYRLGKINADMQKYLSARKEDGDVAAEMVEVLVTEWDILADAGEPIPVTVEAMREHNVPLPVLNTILMAIIDDANPKTNTSTSSGTSGDGSRRRGW